MVEARATRFRRYPIFAPQPAARASIGSGLLDDVFLDRFDGHAGRSKPHQRTLDLVPGTLKLHRDQAHLLGDAGTADVEHQVEFLYQLIKNRLLDEGARIAQVVAFVEAFHLLRTWANRSRRHSCHPIHKLVERYLSPKSGKIATMHPSRRSRAIFSAAIIAAPEDCPTSTPSVCPSAYTIS